MLNRGTTMNSAAPYLKLVGRVLLSIMFIKSGVGKIFGYAGAQAMMEQHGVSGALLPLVILTEAGGGLLVLLGLFTPYAAIAPAGFCLLVAWSFLLAAQRHGPDDQLHEEHHHRRRVPRFGRGGPWRPGPRQFAALTGSA
jgi:uncharacterized membrane protein YphA (DoxX/SURF4 family)